MKRTVVFAVAAGLVLSLAACAPGTFEDERTTDAMLSAVAAVEKDDFAAFELLFLPEAVQAMDAPLNAGFEQLKTIYKGEMEDWGQGNFSRRQNLGSDVKVELEVDYRIKTTQGEYTASVASAEMQDGSFGLTGFYIIESAGTGI